MIGNYQYRTLSEEEVAARRQKLNTAGRLVVLSQLGVLLLLYGYRFYTRRPGAYKRSGFVRALRRWEWRLSNPIAVSVPQLRCPGDWLAVISWAVYCFGLVIWKTGDDYLHLTKAFGIIAAANLPMQFLMSMKRSPLRWILGVSYEGKSNFLHRWLGRIVYTLLCCHVSLYLKFFWDTNRMRTRLLEYDILCGVAGFFVFTVLVISANHIFRTLSYRTFYLFHIVLANALFPLLFLHVSHLRIYLAAAFIFFVVDYATRFYLRLKPTATFSSLAPGLMSITIFAEDLASLKRPAVIAPGVHGLLRVPEISQWTWNPFTFTTPNLPPPDSTSPPEKKPLKLVARTRKGFTRKLAKLHATEPKRMAVILDMAYGSSHFFDLPRFDKILFIAGGVGATFAVSWVKYLLANKLASPDKLRFVWAVKSPQEAEWALDEDHEGDGATQLAKIVELYLTGGNIPKLEDEDEDEDEEESRDSNDGAEDVDDAEVEMRLLTTNGEDPNTDSLVAKGASKESIWFTRPDLKQVVDETAPSRSMGPRNAGSVAVLVSGPDRMAMEMKRIVARKAVATETTEFWLHVEEFGH